MNLSPDWVGWLDARGHDVVHWSTIGREDASDREILEWARVHDRAVLTSDLVFGIMMAMSGSRKPSIVQLRSGTTLPSRVGPLVAQAIESARDDLATGCLLTVEAGRLRLRVLGFDRPH
ncbi:DUF5615 family PIN-like protein [Methylobacterium oryzisoli]|uniref:DUF5615 family PIN-like protein n=1 Tax=Methylobacterium oryzisoli TaxID=3385502 RepID=UPI0038916775